MLADYLRDFGPIKCSCPCIDCTEGYHCAFGYMEKGQWIGRCEAALSFSEFQGTEEELAQQRELDLDIVGEREFEEE